MGRVSKERQREYHLKHYAANKEVYKQRARANQAIAVARNKEFVRQYLLQHPCVDCNEDDIIVLEFDHVTGEKKNDVTEIAKRGYSLQTLMNEISKCEVRCANCHRRVTHKRRQKISSANN